MSFDTSDILSYVESLDFKRRVTTAANADMKLRFPEWDLETVDLKVSNHAKDGTKIAITLVFKENGLSL